MYLNYLIIILKINQLKLTPLYELNDLILIILDKLVYFIDFIYIKFPICVFIINNESKHNLLINIACILNNHIYI